MSCKYCELEGLNCISIYDRFLYPITGTFETFKILLLTGTAGLDECEDFKFCPMCGRNLKDGK